VSGQKPSRAAPPMEYSLLLTATLCLLALGAVMVFSASSAKTVLSEGGGDGFYYLKRVVVFAAVGLLVMRVASNRGVRAARLATPLLLGASGFFLLAVLVPGVGVTVNGAQRWIGAGLFQFQPSELAKVSLILYAAHLLATRPKAIRSLPEMGPLLFIVGGFMLLVAKQPDLGTLIVTTVALGSLLLVAGARPRTLAPLAAGIAVAGIAIIAVNPYQQERLTTFIHPTSDAGGAGFQGRQATIAVGSGGFTGVGLGQSVQKASYLPEAHTDMIAAVIGEEAGLAGMMVLIGLFGMYGYAGFRAAHRARDRYGKLLAAGLTALILTGAALNLFAVLGLAPLTGVPLPFVSYGGTNLIVTLAATGLILNVARNPAAASAKPRSRQGAGRKASARATAGGAARLRVIEGDAETVRRRSSGKSRDSGRRHGGARRTGDRGRRRASR
jgi:cell division protein FtsW